MTRKANAIPSGGGTGRNSAWKFRTNEGKYVSQKRLETASGSGLAIGITSDASISAGSELSSDAASGTSIFDPVLCELLYRWFCPPGGQVLDPFAGGSVRGIVASRLGRRYCGVDLSARQLAANRAQASVICPDNSPDWRHGDSTGIATLCADIEADFVFSCPPYADLEVYSDDPADLSRMAYPAFIAALRRVIAGACARLRQDRFACFVVGDVRDKSGVYYGFPWHTVQAFQDAGLRLYNEAVLVTAIGSLPLRAGKQFQSGRKLGKTHQNVLVFVKGDWKKATQAIGPVDFGEGDPNSEAES